MVGVSIASLKPAGRVLRRPQHTFQIRLRPWQIQPFFIAPVLPGETMKNLLMQSRVVSDPIKDPLTGWWCEFYFFYVKHRDLAQRDMFTNMMLELNYDLSSLIAAANPANYHPGGTIDWVAHCLERVVDEFFRNEGEAVTISTIDGVPVASINNQSWLDSVIDETLLPEGASGESAPGDTQEDLDLRRAQYEFLRFNSLTNMTYEDYLATFGVRRSKQELHRPELVRYVKDWSYPTNHVDPATGAPSSALSWAISERADKDRFFSEPGFLFGVSVVRPKVYLSKQIGTAVSLLDSALTWLPAVMREEPYTSLKTVPAAAGPLGGNTTNDYVVDVRDLFLYGDQFANFNIAAADQLSKVALPTPDMNKRYASDVDADGMFKTPLTANKIRMDGVVSLSIAGREEDNTPTIRS
jgi:hypothetical protein